MLKDQINKDLITAMKEKDVLKKGVLQIVKSAFQAVEKEKGDSISNEDLHQVIKREIKQTKQALEGAEAASREDLIEKEKLKIELLESYLPKQLTKEEIEITLLENGVKSGVSMKDAMKIAKEKIDSSVVDNKMLSTVVREMIK